MNILDLVSRAPTPEPFSEGEKIPWDEPGFSERMLAEHLTQDHDAASRRAEVIDAQVAWIHGAFLGGRPSRVLDLGCGPGLYTSRLARLGHTCHGIDISPASIRHAEAEAERAGLACTYALADARTAGIDAGHFDLAMMLFGELNTFRRADAALLLRRMHEALAGDGRLLLEPHTFEAVRDLGERPPRWHSCERGLFSDRPYVCLEEESWQEELAIATQRWFVVDAETADVTRHAASLCAYTEDDYRTIVGEAGFQDVRLAQSLDGPGASGAADGAAEALCVVTARRGREVTR